MVALVGGTEVEERRIASTPDATDAWTLRVEQLRGEAWRPLQTLTLARTRDGGVELLELINHDRGSRSAFGRVGPRGVAPEGGESRGLMLLPAMLTEGASFSAPVRTWRGKEQLEGAAPEDARAARGVARSESRATREGGAILVTTVLTLEAPPATITRESMLAFASEDGVDGLPTALRLLRDRSTLRVRVGPLTIERSTREATPKE